MDNTLKPERWLCNLLTGRMWTLHAVEFILYRSGSPNFPDQDLALCLHLALKGSFEIGEASESELKDVLVLLIKSGADLYEKDEWGHSVSEIVRDRRRFWRYNPNGHRDGKNASNKDLELLEIWSEALIECGLDAEEVYLEQLRRDDCMNVAECSDGEKGIARKNYYDSRFTELDSRYDTSEESHDTSSLISDNDENLKRPESLLVNQHEQYGQSLLEGDAEIWRS